MRIISPHHDHAMSMEAGPHDAVHGARPSIRSRPELEVADVVRQHGAAFLARYGQTLCGEQHRALRAIVLCYIHRRPGRPQNPL